MSQAPLFPLRRDMVKKKKATKKELSEVKELLRELFRMLDCVEESNDGQEFHPTNISSCRVMHCAKLDEILPRLKEISKEAE